MIKRILLLAFFGLGLIGATCSEKPDHSNSQSQEEDIQKSEADDQDSMGENPNYSEEGQDADDSYSE